MILNEKAVLGTTTEGTIVIANIRIKKNGEFSVSFDEIMPFEATEDYLRMHFESYMESMEDSDILGLLQKYNCPYGELGNRMFNELLYWNGVEGIVDISLYAECFSIEGIEEEIYFESIGCGQGDYRNHLIPLNSSFSDRLYSLWDKYHLDTISTTTIEKIKEDVETYSQKFNLDSTIERLAKEILL